MFNRIATALESIADSLKANAQQGKDLQALQPALESIADSLQKKVHQGEEMKALQAVYAAKAQEEASRIQNNFLRIFSPENADATNGNAPEPGKISFSNMTLE